MYWGEPIIPTAITEITSEGPRYRGHLAVELARARRSFEAVAELLWSGVLHDEPVVWKLDPLPPEITQLTRSTTAYSDYYLLELFSLFVLSLGMSRGAMSDRVRSGKTIPAARQMIQVLTGCFGYASPNGGYVPLAEGERIVEGLARALVIEPTEENHEALEAILITLADHELAPDAFVARIAASSGSALHPCIVAAICTSAGVQIGLRYDRVEELLGSGSTRQQLLKAAEQTTARGNVPPGFGHPLYPKGDPRASYLFDLARRRSRQTPETEKALGFVEDVEAELGLHVRHEVAVVTLLGAMGAPSGCAGALLVLARSTGWVAHVIEQRLAGTYLRPRAKFVRT